MRPRSRTSTAPSATPSVLNVLFDQAVKDDRITIELRDVTARAALERVMQAAGHFYKVLDDKTIIVVPDNPQARRDYEDLVIRTFYLSNGDAEQVTNVVRTMIEARNVFPLKALNAITIRDTADKVQIAEKIIQANDKAKAEVVVQVELVELNLNRIRDIGLSISGFRGESGSSNSANATPNLKRRGVQRRHADRHRQSRRQPQRPAQQRDLRHPHRHVLVAEDVRQQRAAWPTPSCAFPRAKKATLHIGERIPVPVTTISGYNPGTQTGTNANLTVPYTSFQYQDVGIKVEIEPRIHHNREVTLKLTVEVSNQGASVKFAGQEQPTFATRTITSTIRLKDGETNFLAGLIQTNKIRSATKDSAPRRSAAHRPPLHGRAQRTAAHRSGADHDPTHHPHPRHHGRGSGPDVGRHRQQPHLPRHVSAHRVAERQRRSVRAADPQ